MTDDRASRATILLVEDDAEVSRTVAEMLESMGYNVLSVALGSEAEDMVRRRRPDLIVLDLMLPDVDGLVLCSTLKTIADVPIVVCSGTSRKRDTVLALKLGADDFIAKPFDMYELEARIAAVLRRTTSTQPTEMVEAPDEIRVGELAIDRARRHVTLGSKELHLTPTEYRLVSVLAGRPDQVLTRDELALIVWGYQDASSGRTIDMHIRRLRVKLASGSAAAPTIVSVRGFGYKMTREIAKPLGMLAG